MGTTSRSAAMAPTAVIRSEDEVSASWLSQVLAQSVEHVVAVSDLAHFMIPWWPEQARHECEHTVLRHWYDPWQG
jgi:hypothetical protein